MVLFIPAFWKKDTGLFIPTDVLVDTDERLLLESGGSIMGLLDLHLGLCLEALPLPVPGTTHG